MSESNKPIPFLKLSQKNLEELGIVTTEEHTNSRSTEKSSSNKRISFIQIPDGWMEKERQLSVKKDQPKLDTLSSKFVRKIPFPIQNEDIAKRKRSTISRRSVIGKREIQKKTTSHIKNFLYSKTTEIGKLQNKNITENTVNYVKISTSRKKLFKVPPATITKDANTNNLELQKFKHPVLTDSRNIEQSPLIDIEQAEKILKGMSVIESKLIPKVVNEVSTTISDLRQFSPSTSGSANVQPDVVYEKRCSDSEFEQNEKICKDPNKINEKLYSIREILRKDAEYFQQFTHMHETRMLAVYTLLNEISPSSEEPTESKVFKLETPILSKKTLTSTPARSTNKAYDLRINLAKSNLSRKHSEIMEGKHANKVYRNLRKNFSMLETPKFDKNSLSGTKNLSMKLQEQCMLLETPQNKEKEDE